jgi:hypothetical protein
LPARKGLCPGIDDRVGSFEVFCPVGNQSPLHLDQFPARGPLNDHRLPGTGRDIELRAGTEHRVEDTKAVAEIIDADERIPAAHYSPLLIHPHINLTIQ